jgi:hypothetical protein
VKRRGSITVFAALSLMLVAQLLFTLLAAGRQEELRKVLLMNTDSVLESEFADYCSPLWENYRLLGMQVADGEGNFSFANREAMFRSLTDANLASAGLLAAEAIDVEFLDTQLMTDGKGEVFQAVVSAYMKQNLAYETAKSIYNHYESVKSISDGYAGSDTQIENAMNSLEQAATGQEEGAVQTFATKKSTQAAGTLQMRRTQGAVRTSATKKSAVATTSSETTAENPMPAVVAAKKKGILSLVLPKSANVSDSKLDSASRVSKRKLEQGTATVTSEEDWYGSVLVNQYYVRYLSCYTNPLDGRAMNYELEYLIGGKVKDEDNLKQVVKELLAIREALNMSSILASATKQEEALALATLLAGATVNPLIIETVKYGILAAWAYVESILDLRTLLAGGKVALIKTDKDWTSDLRDLPKLLSGWSKAKESSQGISYSGYLETLLYFHSGNTLAMRAMDVQEATVRTESGYENFQMDHVLCETKVSVRYAYSPVFLDFVTLLGSHSDTCYKTNTGSYSYRTGKEDG